MTKVSNNSKHDFRTLIPEYSDEEILKILRKRKQYQPEASGLALAEAIKRGLINSERDLFAEEFQEKPWKFSIFPEIEDEKIQNKIRKSLSRSLLVTGIVPLVWGFKQLRKKESIEGIAVIIGGVLLIYLALRIMRKTDIKVINLILGLVIISMVYVAKLLSGAGSFVNVDFLIPVVIYGLVIYALLFLRRLK